MSNDLAVSTVTAAITARLQAAVDAAHFTHVPTVAPGALDDDAAPPRIVVHLYNIERNADLDNCDTPTRSAQGVLIRRPRTALRLHYLLVFRGADPYETQRLLGVAAAALHAHPVLERTLVAALAATYPAVAGNDLADAHECVRLTPEVFDADALSRLWTLYPVGSFGPTLAYAASPVIVDSDETPTSALPVAAYAVGARVLSAPRLDAVNGAGGPGAPLRATTTPLALELHGAALAAQTNETLQVLIDGTALAPAQVTAVSDKQLDLTDALQTPGTHTVVVSRAVAPLNPALSSTRPPLSSQPVSYTVIPALIDATAHTTSVTDNLATGELSADLAAPVAATQQVRLLLDSTAAAPPVAAALDVTVAAATASVTAQYQDLPTGDYRVTVEVNGARSIPQWSAGTYTLTTVTL